MATSTAKELAKIIESKHLFAEFKGKDGKLNRHVMFEGWQTLGGMLGCTLKEEFVIRRFETIDTPTGKQVVLNGWEAGVMVVRNSDGMIIGRGTGYCGRDESTWSGRQEYAIRSMAITRAGSKALRMVFGWIVELAAYSPTPAEEMTFNNDGVIDGVFREVASSEATAVGAVATKSPVPAPAQVAQAPAVAPTTGQPVQAPQPEVRVIDVIRNYAAANFKLSKDEVTDIMRGIGFPKPVKEKLDLYLFAIKLRDMAGG